MTDGPHSPWTRRGVLARCGAALTGVGLAGLAGCAERSPEGSVTDAVTGTAVGGDLFDRVAVVGTEVVVEFPADADLDRVNLIQPNGEQFRSAGVAAGASRVRLELGTAYPPGTFEVVGVRDGDVVETVTLPIQPDLTIETVGLYRNNPDKPWEEVYGEDFREKADGEVFVTVRNTGTGPDYATTLDVLGDVPNPTSDVNDDGLVGDVPITIPPQQDADLYSDTFPFRAKVGAEGMGCSVEGNSGSFRVVLETTIGQIRTDQPFSVSYSGSDTMEECEVSITET